MSQHLIRKATRMVTEGRISLIESARVYVVEGDTGSHHVIVYDDEAYCDCTAAQNEVQCSHALAALYYDEEEGNTR